MDKSDRSLFFATTVFVNPFYSLLNNFLETRGTNSDSDGLQIISSVLTSFGDTCQCEYRILMLYGLAQENFKSDLALRLSLTLETEKSIMENLMKQYRLGHSALEINNAMRLADKAKQ